MIAFAKRSQDFVFVGSIVCSVYYIVQYGKRQLWFIREKGIF